LIGVITALLPGISKFQRNLSEFSESKLTGINFDKFFDTPIGFVRHNINRILNQNFEGIYSSLVDLSTSLERGRPDRYWGVGFGSRGCQELRDGDRPSGRSSTAARESAGRLHFVASAGLMLNEAVAVVVAA
jgi:hypothetical protein